MSGLVDLSERISELEAQVAELQALPARVRALEAENAQLRKHLDAAGKGDAAGTRQASKAKG